MERRKASAEQLSMLLSFLEKDRDLAMGGYTGLEGKIHQTNAWKSITEKLNAHPGPTKTPDKWQQTWRDWKSNVRKKAYKIQNKNLTDTEQRILNLDPTQIPNNATKEVIIDPSASSMTWSPEHEDCKTEVDSLETAVVENPDTGMGPNEVTSAPNLRKPFIHKRKPVRTFHDRLLRLEEEKLNVKKQKLLEEKRNNKLRIKIEQDRLDIERKRNCLLKKLLNAVEEVANRCSE